MTSFCCFVGAIWHQDRSAGAMVWRVTTPVIAIGPELLQLLGLEVGSFSV